MADLMPPYPSNGSLWVENTKGTHEHGGPGWEFGTCLWSPVTDEAGHHRYRVMELPQTDDVVLHLLEDEWDEVGLETRLVGRSYVRTPARRILEEPPQPGVWANRAPYYRIDLKDFRRFDVPLPIPHLIGTYVDEIRDEIIPDAPRYYPFSRYADRLRTTQGLYLGRCTPRLYGLIRDALGIEAATTPTQGEQAPTGASADLHEEYAEGLRMAKERLYFSRNRQLVEVAKNHYGYVCQICGFDFQKAYGQIGAGYIECHHLQPLAERNETRSSNLADVIVVCANCHRMLHSKRPAITPDILKEELNEEYLRPRTSGSASS